MRHFARAFLALTAICMRSRFAGGSGYRSAATRVGAFSFLLACTSSPSRAIDCVRDSIRNRTWAHQPTSRLDEDPGW